MGKNAYNHTMTHDNKTFLAIESAGGSISACLYKGQVLSAQYADIPYGHIVHLIPMIESVVNASGMTKDDIDAIAVSTGPGFFTGLRIGLATANGLGLALQKPVYGVTTLEAFAHQVNARGSVLIIMETKRVDFYVQVFDGVEARKELKIATIEDIIPMLEAVDFIAGSGVERFIKTHPVKDEKILKSFDFPTAESVAKSVVKALSEGRELTTNPEYHREAETIVKNKQG